MSEASWLDLYDWRARVAAMYREREAGWRGGEDARATLTRFRAAKDALFAHHPQSPLDDDTRAAFRGLPYFDYDPALCVEATLEPAAGDETAQDASPYEMPLRRAATVRFHLGATEAQLTIYWIAVYGGGLFLPFRDATCPAESYGGGRYLFDTVKGSDFIRLSTGSSLGYAGGRVLLDFNYAYNPSCAYGPRWACPLAPLDNRLSLPIRAGERLFHV